VDADQPQRQTTEQNNSQGGFGPLVDSGVAEIQNCAINAEFMVN
jgi:hypothetical protein